MFTGTLIVNVYSGTIALPIENALVEIIGLDKSFYTNQEGRTEPITLEAPNPDYSMNPNSEVKPYASYDIRVSRAGMITTIINNVEIFAGITARQDVFLVAQDEEEKDLMEIDIDDSTLWGDYAPKLPEPEAETETPAITPFVLPRVIIPEYIIVHDGSPSNTTVANYYVPFVDYIKNVACSEIYATWPTETIKANVAAIVSFALNRIFTEWYPSKGYSFTITSTTAYDQKYTHGRTLYDTISNIVDQYFNQYINFPGRTEPYLAQYKAETSTKGQLSQWGSKTLGDQGYSAIQILRYYYGNNLTLKNANVVTGLPTSFPGFNLSLGSCSESVLFLQNQLNIIRGSYPAIPIIANPNGVFDEKTENAVRTFQRYFGPSTTGVVDFATWYRISYYYLAVSKMAQSITT